MTEHQHLRVQARGHHGTVELDGVPLHDAVYGLTFTLGHGDLPRVEIAPLVMTADVEVGGPLHAVIAPATHELLVGLGWTPPGDDGRLHTALAELAGMLGDDDVVRYSAARFACPEVDIVAAVLALSGHRDAAARWIGWHAVEDGDRDRHDGLHRTVNDGATTTTLDPTPARAWVDGLWQVTP